jgi:hypothetical protein
MKRNDYEHQEQCAVIKWRDDVVRLGIYPDLALLYAIPNGGERPKRQNPKTGKWYCLSGQKLRAEGLTPGMPDLHLPVSRAGALSLYIEMKEPGKPRGKADEHQERIHAKLRKQGNKVAVCNSATSAIKRLKQYMESRMDLMSLVAQVRLLSLVKNNVEYATCWDSIRDWLFEE